MSKPANLGSAISAVVLSAMLAGCAAPSGNRLRAGNQDTPKVGVATRALLALNARDFASAVTFAEQAVEANRNNADVRALLGTAYFASGRFASAEAALRDALSLNGSDSKVVLKLVLVQIAQGKKGEAMALLNSARSALETADYGLALALGGQSADAIAVLEPAARSVVADARIRQNLALSYALSGDWSAARAVAAQDVPADQLDDRIQQWMRLASPVRASDQVAALTGVTPVSDPGQPVRLALNPMSNRAVAAAQPVHIPTPAPVAAPVEMAEAVPAYAPPSRPGEQETAYRLETVDVAEVPFVDVVPQPKLTPAPAPRKAAPSVRATAFVPKRTTRPAVANGKSNAVVQIGAYGSPQRVAQAWNAAARRYSALRSYMPVSARFQSAQGPVYRLSVKGFSNPNEAKSLCVTLRRSGGSCFVRNVAGDAPVRIASR